MTKASEYSMLFKLSAQLGREFGTTFSSAKRTLNDTQREINALNQTQADISAYQKQQQAVENTSRKLSDLQKEYDNIQREIDETGTYSSALENKLIEKQRAIDKTSASLDTQNTKLDAMGNAMRDAGIDTSNLSSESEKLTAKLNELAEEQARVTAEAEKYGQTGASAFEVVGNAAIALGAGTVLKELKDEYKECIVLSMEFEETMSSVEAISGASAKEISELTAEAKELGATTKYTAKESAEAMTYMAMAGWDAEQMLSGMSGVIQLAAASGEDLAQVSDIVTDNLTAFGMQASETARFSDVLASSASNSTNTAVAIMGETFKKAAPVAGALGYSIEDVSVATGLMANAGIKGSRAGTALSNTFSGLINGATLTAQAFGEVEYTTVNADGTMKSFGDTINELRGYFDQMSESEKTLNAMAIAGKQGYAGLLAILNASDADFEKLTNSINNCTGAAEKIAAIKLDNLKGDITLANSAADALKTTVGDLYNNELRALTQIGTEILDDINKFASENPAIVKSIIAVTAEVGGFLVAYKSYQAIKGTINTLKAASRLLNEQEAASAAKAAAATTADAAASGADATAKTAQAAATTGATAAQTALNTAMMANPIGLVLAGVAALTVGVIALAEATKKEVEETEALTAASQEQYEQLQELNSEYEEACRIYGETSDEARGLHGELTLLQEDYESTKQTIAEFNEEIDRSISEYESFVAEHKDSMRAIDTELDVTLALISRLEALEGQTNKTNTETAQMANLVDLLNKRVPTLSLSYDKVTDSMSMTVEAMREAVLAQAELEKHQEDVDAWEKSVIAVADFESKHTAALENLNKAQKEFNDLKDSEIGKEYQAILATGKEEDALKLLDKQYRDYEVKLSNANIALHNARQEEEKLNKEYQKSLKDRDDLEKSLGFYSEAIEQNEKDTRKAIETSEEYSEALNAVRMGYLDIATASKYYGVSTEILQDSLNDVEEYETAINSALNAVKEGYYDASEAAEIYGITVNEIEVAAKIYAMIDDIGALGETYNDLKDAAEKSISTQFELWDQAAVVVPTDIDTINTALETQLSYWSDYNTDLENLLARTDDVDGLAEVIASFADGSKESVNAIAGMAASTDEDLRKMVDNWRDVQRQQEEASKSIAELTTGFSSNITQMQKELETAVNALDLDDDARKAAQDMIDSYIKAIKDGSSDAEKEAKKLSKMITDALQGSATMSISYEVKGPVADPQSAVLKQQFEETYGRQPTTQELNDLSSITKMLNNSGITGTSGSLLTIPKKAYASGTDNAEAGLALVGEKGPEIVAFGGGEKVYTAEETKTIVEQLKEYNSIQTYADESGMKDNVQIVALLPELMKKAYASGTDNAEAGLALVGEKGPEIVAFGNYSDFSQPLMAEKTGESHIQISISPTFTIEGNVTDDLESRLREFTDEIVNEVKDALEEAGIDAKRGVYA